MKIQPSLAFNDNHKLLHIDLKNVKHKLHSMLINIMNRIRTRPEMKPRQIQTPAAGVDKFQFGAEAAAAQTFRSGRIDNNTVAGIIYNVVPPEQTIITRPGE
jgi:hypothetical protein